MTLWYPSRPGRCRRHTLTSLCDVTGNNDVIFPISTLQVFCAMTQTIIQQQPVDGDFDDAVDPESDISRDDSGMETDEDDNVHVGGNGNGPWVCVPIDEHYQMSYQPGTLFKIQRP